MGYPSAQSPFVEVADRITGSILDAGCGTGEHALFFAERGNGVTGIDYVEEAIRRAKHKAAERGLSATFLVMDALALAKLAQRFDNVIDCGLLHCFSDDERKKYVEGLAGVLNQGGRLFLLCFSDAEPGALGPRRMSKAELEAAFADGWEIESISPKRIQVIPEFKDQFTDGEPKSWFAIVKRV